MTLLGIDIGSSFIKGGVLELDDLRIRDIIREPFPDPIVGLPTGYFEIDPIAITRAVEQVATRLLTLAPNCSGILFCGQMGGVILADSHGEPLTNYLSWRDQRTTHQTTDDQTALPRATTRTFYDRALESLGNHELQAIGNELKPGSVTTLLSWLADQNKLPAEGTPLNIGDFVVSCLCRSTPQFEITQAIGLIDLATLNWRRETFEKLGIAHLNWPNVTEFRSPVGTMSWQGREIPCYPVIGDQQAALAGVLLAEGELSLNVSTGSQVSMLTREVRAGEFQTRPFFDGWLLNTITHLPAGRSLEVLVDLLSELPRTAGQPIADPWPFISRAAEQATDSELRMALTFFAGPLGERGRVDGISVDNLTVGGLFRAAFRNMAENYETCSHRVAPQRDWSRIVFSGGLVQKLPLLREFIINRLASPYRLCSSSEDALFGLMVLGHVVSGQAKTVAEATTLMR
ncbi:MAG: FGGY family carbohydrate kinase [Planctomycetia bacterium]|nr:FGGY family carbohydrate kinase [Planctomycetia bacterium]